jgi:hypothetical protein
MYMWRPDFAVRCCLKDPTIVDESATRTLGFRKPEFNSIRILLLLRDLRTLPHDTPWISHLP